MLTLLLAVVFTACQKEDAVELAPITVPLRLSVPVQNTTLPEGMQRVIGDPGYAEQFDAPQYVYIFVVVEYEDGTSSIQTISDREVSSSEWTLTTYTGSLRTSGDDVLIYQRDISLALEAKKRTAARVYAAMSRVPLTLSNSSPTTEADILDITFTVDQALQPNLQDVYSTPYNYQLDNGDYYGTVNNIANKVASTELMLYHVASKVDVMWAVPQALRADMKVSGVTARNLYVGQAYLFKPNEVRHELLTTGTTVTLAGNVAATWWEGRQYFYTIPYQTADGKFPIQIDYSIQTTQADTYQLTLLKNMAGADQVFTPWMRCQMTFTGPKSGTETKVVN